jgi:hypothetical protein
MERIVTFTSSKSVHVYAKKNGMTPMPPYKIHSSEENAVKYLKETKGIEEPKIIYK